ncbi:hypothetical protein DUI87_00979 [Hirundo rustica rustica]|uniref:RNA-directed DNA polymerase n=1 Tax=Hirundo rustica rustica TaxID=333673 RepID=A0A3M0L4E7_HIRRU|nr:hypothetical protein DUI87_00979 [Hirundo rustica rustica]
MSPPTSKKETQAFLGAIGFWRMHIPEYSQIVSPLYLVTRKKNDFHWGPEQQQAFAQIKQEIAHAVALGPVRTGPEVKNVLYSAAGNNGLSWSLWQKVPGETRGRPLGFWSRSYRGSEANYTPTEKEILATYEGLQAASEVIGTETQLLLAPRLPVLGWMFKGKVPSTHHATDTTWSKWIALITQRARIGNPNRPGILEIITNWPEGANRKWKAAVWSPTRRVAQATEGQGGSSQVAELKAIQLALDIAEREKWPRLYLYTDSWMVANALWGWLNRWKKANWQRRGKPIWAAEIWQDIAAQVEKLTVKVRHVDAHVSKSQANEEHHNNEQVDKAAKVKVSQVDLDWQHKGEVFLARWAHDASGHQGRDATYRWARDRGVDLTLDNISQVIHNCETCAAIKQAKRVKPLWYGGRWLKYKYGEAWQIDYITLPQTRQGKRYVLTMVEATTGWLETYPVPHATARNTILGLEKQVLWRHGTPERIESDNGTHFKNGLINTWAREHGIEWIYHIPYHAPAAGKVERCNGLLKTTLKALGGGTFKNWELNLAKATWMVNTRGSINRAGPAQSEPLHTVDGDKVPVVHMKGILGKTVWINPTSSKGRPIRGIVFAQGPGSTWAEGQAGYEPLVQEQCQQTGMAALVRTIQLATPQQPFATIIQGIDEPFLCFAGRLTAAVEKQAKASHGFFHQNAHTLQKQFQLTATEAREIVELCDDCHALGAPLPAGIYPRGLKALELWQTDVTQVTEFGQLKYVHVTVDTFSSAMWASAHTGEKARDVIAHWRQAFAVLGIPSAVKTDNGPAYASQQVRQFLQSWGVSHNFGIPHSPTGQAIVERNHGTLKRVLQKQKQGMQGETPHSRLAKALYTINHLTVPQNSNNPVILNHHLSLQASDGEQQPRAKVRVRNLVTKQWEGPYDLIAMGRGYACVSMDTGTRWLPSKCVRPDLRPQRQNSADRQGGSRDQLESHQVDESSSDHSDNSSTDSD